MHSNRHDNYPSTRKRLMVVLITLMRTSSAIISNGASQHATPYQHQWMQHSIIRPHKENRNLHYPLCSLHKNTRAFFQGKGSAPLSHRNNAGVYNPSLTRVRARVDSHLVFSLFTQINTRTHTNTSKQHTHSTHYISKISPKDQEPQKSSKPYHRHSNALHRLPHPKTDPSNPQPRPPNPLPPDLHPSHSPYRPPDRSADGHNPLFVHSDDDIPPPPPHPHNLANHHRHSSHLHTALPAIRASHSRAKRKRDCSGGGFPDFR